MLQFSLYLLTFLIISSALMIIISKNPVHSILFLILVFIGSTGLLILLNVEFIAMLFLVVYVGAIAVLFMFVVMMLNIKVVELNERFIRYFPIGGIIGLIFLTEILFILNNSFSSSEGSIIFAQPLETKEFWFDFFNNLVTLTNVEYISVLLFTKYVYLFILAGMILLVAMIGAIILTLNQNFKNKRQDIYRQVNRDITDAIKYIN